MAPRPHSTSPAVMLVAAVHTTLAAPTTLAALTTPVAIEAGTLEFEADMAIEAATATVGMAGMAGVDMDGV